MSSGGGGSRPPSPSTPPQPQSGTDSQARQAVRQHRVLGPANMPSWMNDQATIATSKLKTSTPGRTTY